MSELTTPLNERMYDALMDAFGHDESDAETALAAVLPLLADDLRTAASEIEWQFRSMTFQRGGCASDTRLHPVGQALRERADALHAPTSPATKET